MESKCSNPKNKLVVIDGNSLLYRAFYAMRHLSTSDGQPTNAVFGFTMMLLRILQEERPDAIAVAFDAPAKTFRHEEYGEYKAHRKPTPDELISQAPIARQMVEAFSIPMIEVPGFEADDIVGTIAKQASEHGYHTMIVTGDLDALQLVSDCVRVMATVKGVTDTIIYDQQAVEDRYGIKASEMVDFKALKGDASDNIPGVAGVGEKTAAKLVRQFGSIENMIQHTDEIADAKLRAKIESGAEQAALSRMLATIVTDVPLPYSIDDLKAKEPDYDRIRSVFQELEFRTLLKRLPETEQVDEPVAEERPRAELGSSRIIESAADLEGLISHLNSVDEFAVRTHTTQGKPTESDLLGVAFSTGIDSTAYVRIASSGAIGGLFDCDEGCFTADLVQLKDLLESPTIKKCGHDLKRDYETLKLRGVKLGGISFDSMLAAYILNSDRSGYSVADVAFEQLSLEIPVVEKKSKNQGNECQNPQDDILCAETEAAWRLASVLREKLAVDGLLELLNRVEMPLVSVLAEIEMQGVAVDTNYLHALSVQLNDRIREIERVIYNEAGHEFNIGSPKQLQTVLFEQMQLPAGRKTKRGFSTDADTLEALSLGYPIVAQVLNWREFSKLKSTYADALPRLIDSRTGRIHTSLNQAVTTTGRLSSSEPNLQNIPIRTEIGREIRKAFIASKGNVLVSADYSQIELRVLAHVTNDTELVRAFESSEDIHTRTASTLYDVSESEVTPDMRRAAKTVNFAVIYGMSDFGLAKELGITNREAHEFIERYFARFPGVRRYTDETLEYARQNGYVVTPLGRRRYVPEIHSGNRNFRMFAERAAVNMPIQGAAADMMKLAMIAVHQAIEERAMKTRMVLQVHDELVFETPPDELSELVPLVKQLMETVVPLSVPVVAEVKKGQNWAEMEPIP